MQLHEIPQTIIDAIEYSSNQSITIQATMTKEVAVHLEQFCNNSTFDQFFDCTSTNLSENERTRQALRMIEGMGVVLMALREAGIQQYEES